MHSITLYVPPPHLSYAALSAYIALSLLNGTRLRNTTINSHLFINSSLGQKTKIFIFIPKYITVTYPVWDVGCAWPLYWQSHCKFRLTDHPHALWVHKAGFNSLKGIQGSQHSHDRHHRGQQYHSGQMEILASEILTIAYIVTDDKTQGRILSVLLGELIVFLFTSRLKCITLDQLSKQSSLGMCWGPLLWHQKHLIKLSFILELNKDQPNEKKQRLFIRRLLQQGSQPRHLHFGRYSKAGRRVGVGKASSMPWLEAVGMKKL